MDRNNLAYKTCQHENTQHLKIYGRGIGYVSVLYWHHNQNISVHKIIYSSSGNWVVDMFTVRETNNVFELFSPWFEERKMLELWTMWRRECGVYHQGILKWKFCVDEYLYSKKKRGLDKCFRTNLNMNLLVLRRYQHKI